METIENTRDKFSILYKYRYSKVITGQTYNDMMNAIELSKCYRSSTEVIGSNYGYFKTVLGETYNNHKNRALDWVYIKYTIKYKLSDKDAMYIANKINEMISNDKAYHPNRFTSLCIVKQSLDNHISNTYFIVYIPFYDPTSLRKITYSYRMNVHFVGIIDFIISKCINNDEVDVNIDNIVSRDNLDKKYKPFGLKYMTQEERNNMKVEYAAEEEW